jgi:hypothetical protein
VHFQTKCPPRTCGFAIAYLSFVPKAHYLWILAAEDFGLLALYLASTIFFHKLPSHGYLLIEDPIGQRFGSYKFKIPSPPYSFLMHIEGQLARLKFL